MQIEVYDERELDPATLAVEPNEEALKIICDLGLEGQVSGTNTGGPTRICYPQPTLEQAFVIGAMFPKRTKIKDYSAGAIPLRVLKEMQSYLHENPDHSLFICHQPPAIVTDPVLMAAPGPFMHGSPDYSDLEKCRMIARWGDALKPWSEMLAMAIEKHRAQVRDALKKCLSDVKRAIAEIDEGCEIKIPRRPGNFPQLFNMPD